MTDIIKKMLIIDDSKFTREIFKHHLSTIKKLNIIGEASNDIEAINLLKKLKPHVIAVDLLMPREGGVNLIKKINKIDPNISIVIISGLDKGSEESKEAMKYADCYIEKPFDTPEIIAVMKKNISTLLKINF